MLSSLLQQKKKVRRAPEQFTAPATQAEQSTPTKQGRERTGARYATADWTETDDNDEETEEEDDNEGRLDGGQGRHEFLSGEDYAREDGDEETPLLPIFSAAHLGTFLHNTACLR
jgi:hypothetical protein